MAWYPLGLAECSRMPHAMKLFGRTAYRGSILADTSQPQAGLVFKTRNGILWGCLSEFEEGALPPVELDEYGANDVVAVGGATTEGEFDPAVLAIIDPTQAPMNRLLRWRQARSRRRTKSSCYVPSPFGFTATPTGEVNWPERIVPWSRINITSQFLLPCFRIDRVSMRSWTIAAFSFVIPSGQRTLRIATILFSNSRLVRTLRTVLGRIIESVWRKEVRMIRRARYSMSYMSEQVFAGDPDEPALWYFNQKRELWASYYEERKFRNPVQPRTLRWRA